MNMMSSEIVHIRHHIRRFLHIYLVLKIKLNTGQSPGTTEKIERRKNMAKYEGRTLFTIETLKTLYCCIESQNGLDSSYIIGSLYNNRKYSKSQ